MEWSRDGRFVLYEEDSAPGSQRWLWILSVAPGDGKPAPYERETFNESMGRFSPNTRWVAFQSDESGRYEIYIYTSPEPHEKVRISVGGGVLPQWAGDGRELFYISPDSLLMSVSLKPRRGSLVPSVPHVVSVIGDGYGCQPL
jgi:Tol biopolymer transport system component